MPKRTPLYETHKKLGAKLVDFAGWEMPVQYTGLTDEHLAVRNAAGLFDVSHMGIFEVSGSDVLQFLDYLTPSNNSNLEDYQAHYSLLLNERGTIVDDIIIYRINPTKFFIVANASNSEKDFGWIKSHLKGKVELKNLNDCYALLALQGPKAARILSKLTDIHVGEIAPFHLSSGTVGGIAETTIARTGYTGEDGFEIFINKNKAEHLWNAILKAGKDDGLKPVGLGARDTLRLEMKYTLYGHEINEETNALEAGLRWVIKFKKPSDFIGKEALVKINNDGTKRKLVGFKMLDKGIPRAGYSIVKEGEVLGRVTSGTFSPSLQTPIGLGYVSSGNEEIGSKIFIDIRGRQRQAEIVKTPFYERPY